MTKHCDRDLLPSSSQAVTKALAACGALALYFHVIPSSAPGLNTPALQRGAVCERTRTEQYCVCPCHRPVLCVVRLYRNDVNYCGVNGLGEATPTFWGLIVFSRVFSHFGLGLEEYFLLCSLDFQ